MYAIILKNIASDILGPFASLEDIEEFIEDNPMKYTVWPQEYTIYILNKIEE
jgi:hypothetical protein